MSLPKLAIQHFHFTIMAFLFLTIMGVVTYTTMPKAEEPPVQAPGIYLIAIYPGASPTDLEELVVNPLEKVIYQIEDLKEVKSAAKNNLVFINIEFFYGVDIDKKFNQLQQKISEIEDELPQDLYSLDIGKMNTTDVSIVQLAFHSDSLSAPEIAERIRPLEKKVEQLSGVGEVALIGFPGKEVRIGLDFEKMAQLNISTTNVSNAIRSVNANIPGGQVSMGSRTFNVKTSGAFQSLEEIRNTVVGNYEGRIIYLKNIAEVDFDYEDEKYHARYNGKTAVFMTVKQQLGVNIYSVTDPLDSLVQQFEREELAPLIHADYAFNQAELVNRSMSIFSSNLFQGILAVGFFIFLALGWRAAGIVMLAIPISIGIGLFGVDSWGYDMQQMVVAGLVIALGLMVDNSIAIVENIERYLHLGLSKTEAAIKGTTELMWPMISATLTTILAFVPIITLPAQAGEYIRSMPLTVMLTLSASLLLAVTLTPLVASWLLKGGKNHIKKPTWMDAKVRLFVQGPFRKMLNFSLNNRLFCLTIAVAMLIGSGFLFKVIGVSFFPNQEKSEFFVELDLTEGSSLAKTDSVARFVERTLQKTGEIDVCASNIGKGNPRIFALVGEKQYSSHIADFFVKLKEAYNREKFRTVIAQLRTDFDNYKGADINLKILKKGVPVEAQIVIRIVGDDLKKVKDICNELTDYMQGLEGLLNIRNRGASEISDFYFDINKDKAGVLGVPVSDIDQTVRAFVGGTGISTFKSPEGKEYNMVIRSQHGQQVSPEDFKEIHVKSMSGRSIPLGQLAELKFVSTPSEIRHFDRQRAATVLADVGEDYDIDILFNQIEGHLKAIDFPKNYSYNLDGEVIKRNQTFGNMNIAAIIAILLICTVLVVQFRSFIQPLVIITAIPFSFIGAALGLYLSGCTFSFTAFIGLISLFGIVINDSIVLVDFTNQLRRQGYKVRDALKEATEIRFMPILLTSVTTIVGILPLTLQGGDIWAPLGWTIIGGLATSTFLILILVPIIYTLLVRD